MLFLFFVLFTLCFMLSTFLCHIVPYGRPRAVLELHWHHGYLKRSGKGQKRTHRPFSLFTLFVSVSLSHTNIHTHNPMKCLVCFALFCALSLSMCGIFMQTETPLCMYVCVCVSVSACPHPLAKSMLVLAHTDRWSTERLFMLAEEFAL